MIDTIFCALPTQNSLYAPTQCSNDVCVSEHYVRVNEQNVSVSVQNVHVEEKKYGSDEFSLPGLF